MKYERQIASARRMIEKAGMICQWRGAAAPDPEAPPWRDGDGAEPDPVDVPVAFFAPSDVGKGGDIFRSFINATEVPESREVGLIPGDCGFDVNMSGTLYRDGEPLRIVRVDRLAPANVPIIYFAWIA